MSVLLIAALVLAQYAPITKYDPGRNAEQDLKIAVVEAQRTGKRILLEVGGEWCSWCHIMDKYFDQNPNLTKLRDTRPCKNSGCMQPMKSPRVAVGYLNAGGL